MEGAEARDDVNSWHGIQCIHTMKGAPSLSIQFRAEERLHHITSQYTLLTTSSGDNTTHHPIPNPGSPPRRETQQTPTTKPIRSDSDSDSKLHQPNSQKRRKAGDSKKHNLHSLANKQVTLSSAKYFIHTKPTKTPENISLFRIQGISTLVLAMEKNTILPKPES